MLTLAMIFWIGMELGAPTWFWVLWGITLFIGVLQFGISMFKYGRNL